MALLRISTHIESGCISVRLNDERVLENTGNVEHEVKMNQDYVLQWYVHGRSGSSYSIVISKPGQAEFQLTRLLSEGGKDYGGFKFST